MLFRICGNILHLKADLCEYCANVYLDTTGLQNLELLIVGDIAHWPFAAQDLLVTFL